MKPKKDILKDNEECLRCKSKNIVYEDVGHKSAGLISFDCRDCGYSWGDEENQPKDDKKKISLQEA